MKSLLILPTTLVNSKRHSFLLFFPFVFSASEPPSFFWRNLPYKVMSDTCFPTFAANSWAFDLTSAQWVPPLEASDTKKQGLWRHCEGYQQSSEAWVWIKAELPTGMSGLWRWQKRRCKLWHLMVSGWTCWDDSVQAVGVQPWLFLSSQPLLFPTIF